MGHKKQGEKRGTGTRKAQRKVKVSTNMGLLDICCVLGMRSALVNQPEGSPTSRAFASQVSQAGDAHVLKKKKKTSWELAGGRAS